MRKHILLSLTMLILPANAMEQQHPYIVYDIDSNTITLDSLAVKLSQKYPCITYSEQDKLSHQSLNVTRIHSQQYLDNIDKHPSTMLSAINNNILMSLYPNRYSKTYFTPMLNNIPATLIATERVIQLQKNNPCTPSYTISCGQGYSFAGHAQGNNGDAYAAIPIAAAYALNTNSIKRILVIDENLNKGSTAVQQYYNNGNGSIFYPENNPALKQLFNGKIITQDKLPSDSLYPFLESSNNPVDLALYNITIEDPDITDKRTSKIYPLLEKHIPTVFILSGDKDKHQETALSIIDYIVESAETITTMNTQQLQLHYLSSSSDSISNDADETSSTESGSDIPRIFKITTDINKTRSFDGAHCIILAHTITINDDGIMEVDAYDYSTGYHTPSPYPSNDTSTSTDSEDSQLSTEEFIFTINGQK